MNEPRLITQRYCYMTTYKNLLYSPIISPFVCVWYLQFKLLCPAEKSGNIGCVYIEWKAQFTYRWIRIALVNMSQTKYEISVIVCEK